MNGNAKCAICAKTVYAMERMDADGMSFHKVPYFRPIFFNT